MKILRGEYKGRNLVAPADIRPVSVLVRKACFDILGEEVSGRRVLDLFAGSGSLGIEALSSGARSSVFVDAARPSFEAVRRNLTSLGIVDRATVILKDAPSAVKDFSSRGELFSLIFLDPPYYKGALRKILQTLEEYDIVTPFGYLVGFCYYKDDFLNKSKVFSLITKKQYGQTLLLIYRKDEASDLSRNV